jgi:hypothetical protein
MDTLPSDLPPLHECCTPRTVVARLADVNMNNAFESVLQGCFVRVRAKDRYVVGQIASVSSGVYPQFLVDLVTRAELQALETISNSAPTREELLSWYNLMVSQDREFPMGNLAQFMTAKKNAVEKAMEEAGMPFRTDATPTGTRPRRLSRSPTTTEMNACGSGGLCIPLMQPLLSDSNDRCISVSFLKNNYVDPSGVIATFTRHSNIRHLRGKPQDYSGAAALFAKDAHVVWSRDITPKGYRIYSSPVHFDGWYYVAAHRLVDGTSNELVSSVGKEGDTLVLLAGRDMFALWEEPVQLSACTQLPWAADGFVRSPTLVATEKALHLFWLSTIVEDGRKLDALAQASTSTPLKQWTLLTDDEPLFQGRQLLFHVASRRPIGQDEVTVDEGYRLFVCVDSRSYNQAMCGIQYSQDLDTWTESAERVNFPHSTEQVVTSISSYFCTEANVWVNIAELSKGNGGHRETIALLSSM